MQTSRPSTSHTCLTTCRIRHIVTEFLDVHSLTDSASKPSLPKKKKLIKNVSDMTEEEQLRAAMMASMGGDPSSAIEIPQEDEDEISPEPTKGITFFLFRCETCRLAG